MTAMQGTRDFGVLSDGRVVTEYTLKNRHGHCAGILDYGGIIRTLLVPDKLGRFDDIVLGFDNLNRYEEEHPYFGAVIGRVAGRISGGRAKVNGETCQLSLNDPPNHLHGGVQGFDHKLWQADYLDERQPLVLHYESVSGEEGYPGKLRARVTYSMTDDNELIVDYYAIADVPTVVNLTQHSYFNLSGDFRNTIFDHNLEVIADQVLELDEDSLPTGRVLDVSDSRFDFRTAKRIDENDSDGYDHFWVLPEGSNRKTDVALMHADSGRILQLATTAPGVQIYTGNALTSDLVGKDDTRYGPMTGIALETQIHPDSTNHPAFPTAVIHQGGVFESTTIFRFLTST